MTPLSFSSIRTITSSFITVVLIKSVYLSCLLNLPPFIVPYFYFQFLSCYLLLAKRRKSFFISVVLEDFFLLFLLSFFASSLFGCVDVNPCLIKETFNLSCFPDIYFLIFSFFQRKATISISIWTSLMLNCVVDCFFTHVCFPMPEQEEMKR